MWHRNPHRGGGRPGPGPDPERDALARVTQVQNQVVRQGPLSTQDFSLLPQTSRLNVRTLLLPCSLVPVHGCPKPASVPGQFCAASGPPRSRCPLTPPPPSSAFRLSSRSATCLPAQGALPCPQVTRVLGHLSPLSLRTDTPRTASHAALRTPTVTSGGSLRTAAPPGLSSPGQGRGCARWSRNEQRLTRAWDRQQGPSWCSRKHRVNERVFIRAALCRPL